MEGHQSLERGEVTEGRGVLRGFHQEWEQRWRAVHLFGGQKGISHLWEGWWGDHHWEAGV
jgi:hypothetical protein